MTVSETVGLGGPLAWGRAVELLLAGINTVWAPVSHNISEEMVTFNSKDSSS